MATLYVNYSPEKTLNKDYKNINSLTISDAIDPLCTDEISSPREMTELGGYGFGIVIPKSGKWYENLNQAALSKGESIGPEFKKEFNAKFKIINNEKECSYAAKVRIAGDWKDHLGIVNGAPVSSLEVELKEGNLAGIVNFKLLLPRTRNGVNEIFITALMRKLDLLAPRTRFIDVSVNGIKVSYLLQENLEKELIESQSRREGPILEVNEALIFKLHQLSGEFDHRLTSPKITNSKWLEGDETRLEIGMRALDLLGKGLSTNWKRNEFEYDVSFINTDTLSNADIRFKQKNQEFLALMYALEAQHGLTLHNRRFYYDPMFDALEPIYYDGNGIAFLSTENPIKVDSQRFASLPDSDYMKQQLKEGSYLIENKIKDLDFANFQSELQNLGFEINNDLFFQIFEFIKNRLNHYQTFTTDLVFSEEFGKKNYDNVSNLENIDPFLIFLNVDKSGTMCTFTLSECTEIMLDYQEIKDLFSGDYKFKSRETIFVAGTLESYKFGEFKSLDVSEMWQNIPDFGEIKIFGEVDIKVNQKEITLTRMTSESRILIRGEISEGWKIRLLDNSLLTLSKSRFEKHLLTGCITFVDSSFSNLKIEATGAKCEDSVNFIRSHGNIAELLIQNTYQDALDMDFSQIIINLAKIENSGNDCLDLSAGNYLLENIYLSNCSDKGVSVGEKSQVHIFNLHSINSHIGIASKGWSKVNVANANFSNIEICLAAYRKKQEFGMGEIYYSTRSCDSRNDQIQEYSIAELKK